MRFLTSKLAVLTGTLKIQCKKIFTCQKVETNPLFVPLITQDKGTSKEKVSKICG